MNFKILPRKLLFFGGVVFIFFIGLLYFIVNAPVEDYSTKPPFSSLINKKVITKEASYIVLMEKHTPAYTQYRLLRKDQIPENAESYSIPIRGQLNFSSAKPYMDDDTGYKTILLRGSTFVYELGREVPFEYLWGDFMTPLEGRDYYVFPKAPWQEKDDNLKYFYPEGSTAPYEWE